jgi:hypothetical protein
MKHTIILLDVRSGILPASITNHPLQVIQCRDVNMVRVLELDSDTLDRYYGVECAYCSTIYDGRIPKCPTCGAPCKHNP